MKQVLTVPDASGLTPLELPAALARQEGDTGRPPPSQDVVSRFQAAMGEAQPVAGQVEGGKWKVDNIFAPPPATSAAPPTPEADGGMGNGERGMETLAHPAPDTRPDLSISHPPLSTPAATGATSAAPVMAGSLESPEGQEGRVNPSAFQPFNASTPPTATTAALATPSDPEGHVNPSTLQPFNPSTSAAATSAAPATPSGLEDLEGRGNPSTLQPFNPLTPPQAAAPETGKGTVQRLNGPMVERSNGPMVERSNGPTVQRSNGPTAQRTNARTTKQLNVQTAEEPTPLQAAPIAMLNETARTAAASAASPTVAVELEIDPTAATARTQELVDAAAVVADTILVTPSLVHGEGEVTIRLRPTVLDGSEIRLEAKGESITVALTPATAEVQRLAEQSQARFAAELSERIPSFQIAVVVNPRQTTSRRDLRDETA